MNDRYAVTVDNVPMARNLRPLSHAEDMAETYREINPDSEVRVVREPC